MCPSSVRVSQITVRMMWRSCEKWWVAWRSNWGVRSSRCSCWRISYRLCWTSSKLRTSNWRGRQMSYSRPKRKSGFWRAAWKIIMTVGRCTRSRYGRNLSNHRPQSRSWKMPIWSSKIDWIYWSRKSRTTWEFAGEHTRNRCTVMKRKLLRFIWDSCISQSASTTWTRI